MKILRKEVEECMRGCGGLNDAFDDVVRATFNITDDEYNKICEKASDEELDLFASAMGSMESKPTFGEIRKGFLVRNKYVPYFNAKSKQNSFTRIFNNIPPEIRAKVEASMEAHEKYMDEHPDYNKKYGTPESYWLETIKSKGFNPVGITVMVCEETIIMETQEECDRAWEVFKPEGWWYVASEWESNRKEYVKDAYEGDEERAPKVYCLDERFKEIIK